MHKSKITSNVLVMIPVQLPVVGHNSDLFLPNYSHMCVYYPPTPPVVLSDFPTWQTHSE